MSSMKTPHQKKYYKKLVDKRDTQLALSAFKRVAEAVGQFPPDVQRRALYAALALIP